MSHHSLARFISAPVLLCAGLTLWSSVLNAQTANQPALLIELLQQQRAAMAGTVPPHRASLPPVTEAQLGQQLQAWPRAIGPFELERFRDGFSINGQRMLDPEGQITQYAIDADTGDFAYLAQVTPGQFVLKLGRPQAGTALTVAQASRQGGLWMVETSSGVKLNGARLILTPRGVMVARENVFFRWTAGQALQSFAAPETHMLAAHQNGDVAATGWVLLEKRADAKQEEAGPLGALFGSVKRIGASLGVNSADADFALYNFTNRKMLPIAIAMEEKQTSVMRDCRRKNNLVNICDKMDSVESLYGQDGFPNRGHYFWRVSWFRTSVGPVAVLMENGISKIEAVNLTTDQRAVLFQRTLGIGDWSTRQSADGRIKVQARLGLDTGVNEDVVATLAAVPVVSAAGASGAAP